MTAIVFNPVTLHFATAQGRSPDLLEAINRHLKLMKSQSGSIYYKSLGCWMERPPRVVAPRYLFWVMATSFGIIKQHGGSIWVYSESEQGTTFKIYLPMDRESVIPQKKDITAPVNLKGWETIFVVEDNEQVRDLACAILRQQGYPVLCADSGNEALATLDAHAETLHLLLTDVVMSGMNGRELFDRISARFPKVKVLFMSGYTDDLIAYRGVLEKGLHFIQKPFSVKTLAAMVRTVLVESK